jgi:hypothetical protein
VILVLAAKVERFASTNILPATETELCNVLGEPLPMDGWGKPVHYARIETNRFTVTAFSPWPEVLVFQYDSTRGPGNLKKYPFL